MSFDLNASIDLKLNILNKCMQGTKQKNCTNDDANGNFDPYAIIKKDCVGSVVGIMRA